MATITRFEDLKAWQKARVFARDFSVICHERKVARDFALANQIRSACLSPMSNIAEGFGRRTDKEFIAFLSNAHGSIAECQSLLYVLLDEETIRPEVFSRLYGLAEEVSRLIQGLANYLAKRQGSRASRHRLTSPDSGGGPEDTWTRDREPDS